MILKNHLLNYSNTYIIQDTNYFMMSLDSLLLANFVTINLSDKRILDIATGNAPIPMLLTFRTNAKIYAIEKQKPIYSLAYLSVSENNMLDRIELINDDAKNLTNLFDSDYFDVITCNPPYFKTNNIAFENDNPIKASARHEKSLNVDDVLKISRYLLKTNGRLAIIHRTERVLEIIELMKKYNFEPKKIRFIYPNKNKNSDLVLIEAIKNGKSGLKLLPPLIVYEKEGVYSKEITEMFGE